MIEPRSPAAARGAPQIAVIGAGVRLLSRVSTSAASRIAYELFRTPRRHPAPERERALLHDAEPFELRLSVSTTIKGWSWGTGPLVILVHGWEGRGSQLAPFAGPLVRYGFRVIAFDAPGHGSSSGRQSSLPHFAWALRGVADAEGRPQAVIGHSLGCAAATLAMRDGLAIPKAVFVAPPLNPADYTRQFGTIFGLSDDVIDGLRNRIEERFLRKWDDYSLESMAPAMSARLLVVHDRDDLETPWAGGARLVDLWSGARLLTTEGLGHRRILREPSIIEEAAAFIAS